MAELNRILVPIDLSPTSRAALDYAAFLAHAFSATIHVVHVWRPPLPTLGYDAPILVASESVAAISRAHASEELVGYVRPLRERGFVVTHHLEAGDTLDAIVKLASTGHYDLIVMATHGRIGMAGLLHRHVAEKIVRRAPCPVLTVHVRDEVPVLKRRREEPSIEASP